MARLFSLNMTTRFGIGEDGFNRKIINRCNEICELARNQADLIKVYGTFLPSQAFHHYANGVDLMLDAIEINGVLIDTDFNDHGKIKEKTPTVMRKIYKGGKEVAKLIKKRPAIIVNCNRKHFSEHPIFTFEF